MPPAVREDPADVGEFGRHAAEHDVGDGAGGIGCEFDRRRADAGHDLAAAVWRGRMDIDHGLAAVELGIDRLERRIAKIFVAVAREQPDAVGLERIEDVFDLLQAALRVGRRDRCEQAEAAGVVLDHLGAILVAIPGEPARQRDIIVEPCARLHERDDRGRDPALVHLVERHLRGPLRRPAAAALGRHDVGVNGRDVMVMDVDPGFGRGRRLRQRCGGAESKT